MDFQNIPLFPLNTVFFPDGYLPLQIFEVRYLDMIKRAIAERTPFGVVSLIQGPEVRAPDRTESFADIGTLAYIASSVTPMPGLIRIQCTGGSRFRVESSERMKHGLWTAQVSILADDQVVAIPAELEDTAAALAKLIAALEQENTPAHEMPMQQPFRLDQCGWVANRWAELLPLPSAQKHRMLALDSPVVRLELVQDVLNERGALP
ncbi:MAG: LON peptidase substrate-binding domain-containing protein [Burkholderiaceae bacterium]